MYQIGHEVGCRTWVLIYSWDILPNTHRSTETSDSWRCLLLHICPMLLCVVTQQVNESFGICSSEARESCGDEQWPGEDVCWGDVSSQPCLQDLLVNDICPFLPMCFNRPNATLSHFSWQEEKDEVTEDTHRHTCGEKKPEVRNTLISPISKFFFSSTNHGSPDIRLFLSWV